MSDENRHNWIGRIKNILLGAFILCHFRWHFNTIEIRSIHASMTNEFLIFIQNMAIGNMAIYDYKLKSLQTITQSIQLQSNRLVFSAQFYHEFLIDQRWNLLMLRRALKKRFFYILNDFKRLKNSHDSFYVFMMGYTDFIRKRIEARRPDFSNCRSALN